MPVFTKLSGRVLVVTVDGDYTPQELRRVGELGIRAPETPSPARVLLDVSGAAGGGARTPSELADHAAFFVGLGPEVGWVAIQAPGGPGPGIAGGEVFRTRAEAVAWLEAQGEAG